MSKPILSRHARGPAVFLRQQSIQMKELEWEEGLPPLRTPAAVLNWLGQFSFAAVMAFGAACLVLPDQLILGWI